jgi:hypothetical protein
MLVPIQITPADVGAQRIYYYKRGGVALDSLREPFRIGEHSMSVALQYPNAAAVRACRLQSRFDRVCGAVFGGQKQDGSGLRTQDGERGGWGDGESFAQRGRKSERVREGGA